MLNLVVSSHKCFSHTHTHQISLANSQFLTKAKRNNNKKEILTTKIFHQKELGSFLVGRGRTLFFFFFFYILNNIIFFWYFFLSFCFYYFVQINCLCLFPSHSPLDIIYFCCAVFNVFNVVLFIH